MAIYLLDSSAVVKRYVKETGTSWLSGLFNPTNKNSLVLVRVAGVEVVSAITRKSRGGGLSSSQAALALLHFEAEFGSLARFSLIEVDATLISRAMELATRHGLRGYDAVQLAGALELFGVCQATGVLMSLVSADTTLNTAAVVEGLRVDNPNDHP